MMDPLVRAEGYWLLARCFGEAPGADLRGDLASAAGVPGLEPLAALAPLVNDTLPEERVALFGRGVRVSPHETGWLRTVTGIHLGQIATLYELFGAHGGAGERVDHVGTELEFTSLLSLKEGMLRRQGDEEGATRAAAARKVFVEEHLGRWAPRFCAALEEQAGTPFWVALAHVLDEFMAEDCGEHDWTPAPFRDPRPSESAEPMVCPHACET